jgi:photosystem II stability/assembly factor-like uncharacterized protein
MERRTFLKTSFMAVAALGSRLAFPSAGEAAGGTVSYGGLLYRAGSSGKILKSADAGRSWSLHSDLGDMYSITKLGVVSGSRLRLTVGYGGRSFGLFLAPNGRSWLTA